MAERLARKSVQTLQPAISVKDDHKYSYAKGKLQEFRQRATQKRGHQQEYHRKAAE